MSEKDNLLTPSSEDKVDDTARYDFLADDYEVTLDKKARNEAKKEAAKREAEESIAETTVKEVEIKDVIKEVSMDKPVVEEKKAPVTGEQDIEDVIKDSVPVVEEPVQKSAPVVEEPVQKSAPVVEESVQESAPVVEDTVQESASVVEETAAVAEDDSSYMRRSFITDDGAMADKEKFQVKDSKKSKKKKEKKKGRKLKTYQQRQNRLGYAFMSPWILGFIIFTLFPFVATIYLSFTEVKSTIYGYQIKFIGIDNYITAFVKNTDFLPALLEFIKVIVPYTFIVVVISFIIAFLLNKITKGKGLLRTIYFLPVIIMSGPVMNQLTAVDTAAETAAAMSGGTVTTDYSNIFIMQIIDSYSPALATALGSVFDQLSIILWFTGIPIVLFINALQKINVSIYEAAKIDSANAWQIMWKITIPMLKQIGLIITIFTVIQLGMYETVNPVYKLIIDATGDTTGGLGFAATYSWIYSFVVLALIGIVFLLFRDKKGKRGA